MHTHVMYPKLVCSGRLVPEGISLVLDTLESRGMYLSEV